MLTYWLSSSLPNPHVILVDMFFQVILCDNTCYGDIDFSHNKMRCLKNYTKIFEVHKLRKKKNNI